MNPFNTGYYTEHDLSDAGFKSIGHDVRISKNCTIAGLGNISIGSHVRIDGYCSLIAPDGGFLEIGSYIHIGGYCLMSAGEGITVKDFSTLSHGVKIFTRNDDYSGKSLTNPTVPDKYKSLTRGSVILERHVIVGCGTVVLPDLTIGEGSAVGALSLVAGSLDGWGIYAGVPVRKIRNRSQELLQAERQFLDEIQASDSSSNAAE